MRKQILFAVAMLGLLAACTKSPHVIKGCIFGEEAEGKTVYLYEGTQFHKTVVDSAVIEGGRFTINSDTLPNTGIYTLVFFLDDSRGIVDKKGYVFRPVIPFFWEGGNVSISADWNGIPMDNLNGTYNYEAVRITAPLATMLYVDYAKRMNKWKLVEQDVWKAYNAYLSHRKERRVSEGIEAVEKLDSIQAEMKAFARSIIDLHRNSTAGLFVFKENLSLFTVDEIEQMIALFPEELFFGDFGASVLAEAQQVKASAVGAKFADFTFRTPEGDAFRLSDMVGQGRYVLLDFWGPHCGPCKAEIPHLKEVYELYHPEGFDIISISIDPEEDKWLEELERQQMPWTQVVDLEGKRDNLSGLYNFQSIPTCILIDPDGIIVHRNLRGSWTDKEMIKLFGNKFNNNY